MLTGFRSCWSPPGFDKVESSVGANLFGPAAANIVRFLEAIAQHGRKALEIIGLEKSRLAPYSHRSVFLRFRSISRIACKGSALGRTLERGRVAVELRVE